MANAEKLSVSVTPEIADELRAAVEGGEYDSVADVVRDAIRDWRLKRKFEAHELDALRRLAQEGIDSGPGVDAETVFARLRARFPKAP